MNREGGGKAERVVGVSHRNEQAQAVGSLTLAAVFMPKERHPMPESGTRASDHVRTRQAAYRKYHFDSHHNSRVDGRSFHFVSLIIHMISIAMGEIIVIRIM